MIGEFVRIENHWSYLSDEKFDKFILNFLKFMRFQLTHDALVSKIMNECKMHSIAYTYNWLNESIHTQFHEKFPYIIPEPCEYADLPKNPLIRPSGYHIWKFRIGDTLVDVAPNNMEQLKYQTDELNAYVIKTENEIISLSTDKVIPYKDFINTLIGLYGNEIK